MTERFKVSTKKSLHGPIEIEVDGKVYSRPLITISLLKEVEKHEKKIRKGDFEAMITQINLLTGIPKDLAKQIDIKDLEAMLDHISMKLYGRGKKADAKNPEKKGSKPGPPA